MADRHHLSSLPHDDPVDEIGAIASPLRYAIAPANALLEMSRIPVVTQNSQEGESYSNRLRLLYCFNGLTLS